MGNQQINHIAAVTNNSIRQGRQAVAVPQIDARARFQQNAAALDGPAVRRPVQRRAAVAIAGVHGRAALQGGADARHISPLGEAHQRRRVVVATTTALACHRRHARAGDGLGRLRLGGVASVITAATAELGHERDVAPPRVRLFHGTMAIPRVPLRATSNVPDVGPARRHGAARTLLVEAVES